MGVLGHYNEYLPTTSLSQIQNQQRRKLSETMGYEKCVSAPYIFNRLLRFISKNVRQDKEVMRKKTCSKLLSSDKLFANHLNQV